ncbi:MAG: type IV pilin protein [Candidatus Competibacterales bacterium]
MTFSNPLSSIARRSRRQRGFTLVEMMIVVLVVAILAAVAYPSYYQSVVKSRRAMAKNGLQTVVNWLENKYTINGTYLNPATAAAFDLTAAGLDKAGDGNTDYYNIAYSAGPTATTYTLSATPIGTTTQADDKCGTFFIDQANTRTVSGGTLTAADCWR